MKPVNGFTLLELIVTLPITTLLITIGVPAVSQWVKQAESRTLQYTLIHSIQYARKQAIHLQTPITLCPGSEKGCEVNWGESLLIFTDLNRNASLDKDETLLKTIRLNTPGKQLSWNRRKAYLRFASRGSSGLTGTLKYCSAHQNDAYNFGIVVSRVGRIRVTDDVTCF